MCLFCSGAFGEEKAQGGVFGADSEPGLGSSAGVDVLFDFECGLGFDRVIDIDAHGTFLGAWAAATGNPIGLDPGGDTVPGDASTTFTIDVGGSVTGQMNTVGDRDWFAITLEAGQFYDFNLFGSGGLAGVTDTYLRLRDSAGNIVAENDDIDFSGNNLFSQIIYLAEAGGTYYLDVGTFDDSETGQYTLTADTTTVTDAVLDSIDWGTAVTLDAGNVIQVYFAANGETFDFQTSAGWTAFEQSATIAALQTFENIIDVTFEITTNSAEAEFILVQNAADPDLDGLGYFNPPGEFNEGVGWFNNAASSWGATGLLQGGDGFQTLIHEFGHGLGLAHPHDNGGTSTVMIGVNGPFDSYGLFDLNQNIYTMMSYNRGWATAPHGATPSLDYGGNGTPMALDIAILQARYGANTTFNSGDNIYVLPNANVSGTFYAAIWDTGGNDGIRYSGATDVVIDLRPATIDYSEGGGGYVSFVAGIHGGFTIAQNVLIESGWGGTGADFIIGNDAANDLRGRGGGDDLSGGLGADTLLAGADNDTANGGEGDDTVNGGGGNDTIGGDAGADLLVGNVGSDVLNGGDGDDTLRGGAAGDVINGDAGIDTATYTTSTARVVVNLTTGAGTGAEAAGDLLSNVENVLGTDFNDVLTGSAAANELNGGVGDDTLAGSGGADTLLGAAGVDNLDGGAAADALDGGAGDDTLNGGLANDTLTGNTGADIFVFNTALGASNVDAITDFSVPLDTINLDNAVFTGLALGALAAGAFHIGAAAGDANDRIVYDSATGALYFDADGTGAGAQVRFATLGVGLALTAADFTVI